MMMSDRKIIHAIEQYFLNGKFVIFPYGKWGKRVKYILNKKYKIQEIAIVDNILSRENDNVLSTDDLMEIEGNYVVLFAVSNFEVYAELLAETKKFAGHLVCDIASVKCADEGFFSFNSDKLYIDDCDDAQKAAIFEITRQTWSQLGRSQPYWSVLTSKKYLLENINKKEIEEFYESGRKHCESIIQTLIRNEVIKDKEETKKLDITEIGCGTGRVTKFLAEEFGNIVAIDVSEGNMKIAQETVVGDNVSFSLCKEVKDYEKLPKTDVVYSIIVLQHNVPPVIEYILHAMLRSLKVGGMALFQIPTYREAYEFKLDAYLEQSCVGKIEMHLLPQKRVFEIANQCGCIPMEVYQDGMSGQDDFSTTFVMKRIM